MSNVQSTNKQRTQWRNLQNFNAAKNNSQLGKAEIINTSNEIKDSANFTRINKSSPVK